MMTSVSVQKVNRDEKAAVPVFEEFSGRFDEIQKRAFELFEKRMCAAEQANEDWLRAEQEVLGSPAVEFADKGNAYELRVALPGFDARDVQVIVTEDEVIVHAVSKKERQSEKEDVLWTELRDGDIYRRIHVPTPIEAGKIEATLEQGILRITAPKFVDAREKALVVIAA